jgi:kynurenine 3-monooxygenase
MTEAEKHEEVSFRFNQKLVKLDMKRNHLLMNDTEQDETYEVSSDVIFGADGAYSRVRYGMQKMPRFNYSQDHLPHVYKELTIPAGPNGEF